MARKRKSSAGKGMDGGNRVLVNNRKAFRDFDIEDRFEAGMVLVGSEIKSIRNGGASLRDAYATIEAGEVWLLEMSVAPYMQASHFGHDQRRPRKLLLHSAEIRRLAGKITEKGYTLVPLKLYLKDGKAKLELGLGRGKRLYDKRQDLSRRDSDLEMERALRDRNRRG